MTRQLSIRESFALQEFSLRQQKQQESQDRATNRAQATVQRMFRPNAVSAGVLQLLENAVSRIERCREEDTDENGKVRPSPMSRSALDLVQLDPSVQGLPQRRGGFAISPEGRTDEKGRPLHFWHDELGAWIPCVYGD